MACPQPPHWEVGLAILHGLAAAPMQRCVWLCQVQRLAQSNTEHLGSGHHSLLCAISVTCDGPDCVPWPSPWPNPHAEVLLQNMPTLGDRIFIEVIKLKWGLGWTVIQYKDIPYILYPYIVILGRGSINTVKERGKTTLRHKERPSYKPRTQVWHRSRP